MQDSATGVDGCRETGGDKRAREKGRHIHPCPYYMELTKLLLNHASDNIPKADEICTLVKDIWDTRIAKLRLSADSFISQQEAHAKLDNLTLMEINTTRSFLLDSLNGMYKLRSNLQPGSSGGKAQDHH